MLTHLIVLLDDTSVSYCHYEVQRQERRLIALEDLKRGIIWAMKENLNIQFVYPDYELPAEYLEAIDGIDHTNIKPSTHPAEADVVVSQEWDSEAQDGATYIVRCSRRELAEHLSTIKEWLQRTVRINVVLTDIKAFSDADIEDYKAALEDLAEFATKQYATNHPVQLNLLTDRIMLRAMNNCSAGDGNVTLAPNGRFYLCPAFYYDDENDSIGDLQTGLNIKNPQLLKLEYAPLCRQCDAYQCKRCIWQNQRLTMDINTPSYQQCVVAHIERNASRSLLAKFKEKGIFLRDGQEIKEIDYLDPFKVYNKWR